LRALAAVFAHLLAHRSYRITTHEERVANYVKPRILLFYFIERRQKEKKVLLVKGSDSLQWLFILRVDNIAV
jgi:hypothetical protein